MKEFFDRESQGTFASVVTNSIAPQLEGKTPVEPEGVHGLLEEVGLPDHPRVEAASAFDVALHDI